MLVKDCMTKKVDIANPKMMLAEAAQKMKSGDYGILPVGENDRLVGMITDRDIAVRAVAEGKDPKTTSIKDVMSDQVLYCYEDQDIIEVTRNMGERQIRRLPVLNREKRLVGILSLGDVALRDNELKRAGEALGQISQHEHNEPQMQM